MAASHASRNDDFRKPITKKNNNHTTTSLTGGGGSMEDVPTSSLVAQVNNVANHVASGKGSKLHMAQTVSHGFSSFGGP